MPTIWHPRQPYHSMPWITDYDIITFNNSYDGEFDHDAPWNSGEVFYDDAFSYLNETPDTKIKEMMLAVLENNEDASKACVESMYQEFSNISLIHDIENEFCTVTVKILQPSDGSTMDLDVTKSDTIIMAGIAGLGSIMRLGFVEISSFMLTAVYTHDLIAVLKRTALSDATHLENFMKYEYPIFADSTEENVKAYANGSMEGSTNYVQLYEGYKPSYLNEYDALMEFVL